MYGREVKIRSLSGSVDAMGDIITRFVATHENIESFDIVGTVPTSQNTVIIIIAYKERSEKSTKLEYEI